MVARDARSAPPATADRGYLNCGGRRLAALKGYVTSTEERTGSAARRIYRATPTGVRALAVAKLKGRELFGELFEDDVGWTDRHYYNAIERRPG